MSENEYVHWTPDMMVEVEFAKEDDFLKIAETLTRIGIPNNKTKTLYQSCHILHKRQKYYITHFKELFALDHPQKDHTISEEDLYRRNLIAKMLDDWNLLQVKSNVNVPEDVRLNVKVVKYKDKFEWNLMPKYTIGN